MSGARAMSLTSFNAATTAQAQPTPNVYSSYKIYKTKTALDIGIVRPKVGLAGKENKYTTLKRPGSYKLTFGIEAHRWLTGQYLLAVQAAYIVCTCVCLCVSCW